MLELNDDVFFSSHSWHALHAFTKFTAESVGALFILMHAALQVVYCHYMLTPFMECLWYMLNFDTLV